MIRPRRSSPHHSLTLVLALTAIRASKPFPLVHITSSAPSMLIALGGENPLSNSLFVQAAIGWSSYRPPFVISAKTMRATLSASATAADQFAVNAQLGAGGHVIGDFRQIIIGFHRRRPASEPVR
jgi:hypothetical protein